MLHLLESTANSETKQGLVVQIHTTKLKLIKLHVQGKEYVQKKEKANKV